MERKIKNYAFNRQNDSSGSVKITGDLSLNNISNLKDEFVKLFNDSKPVRLVVDNPDVVDLGFIQLMRSFIFSMAEKGVKITAHLNVSEDQSIILKRSGIKLEY